MKIPTRSSRIVRRNLLGGWIGRALTGAVLAMAGVILPACGDSALPTGTGPSATPDTSTLAGTWRGSVDGSGGYSGLTNLLHADSSFSGEGDKAFYCKVTGTWTVSGGKYTSTGRACDGTIVTSVAPFNKLSLTGTWSGSNGTSGTFTVAKLP